MLGPGSGGTSGRDTIVSHLGSIPSLYQDCRVEPLAWGFSPEVLPGVSHGGAPLGTHVNERLQNFTSIGLAGRKLSSGSQHLGLKYGGPV